MQKRSKYFLLVIILIIIVLSNTVSLGDFEIENKKFKSNVKNTLKNETVLEVSTDSGVYDPGEILTIYLTNVGDEILYGCGPLVKIYNKEGKIVYEEAIYSWYELDPGEYIIFTWNQTDKNGSQVTEGIYKIEGSLFGVGEIFVNCCLFAVTYEDLVTNLDGILGENNWYISCVTLTILYDPDIIMVVLVNGENYTEPLVVCEDGSNSINIDTIDWEGNPGAHFVIIIDIDITKPIIELVYEIMGGNIFTGWDLLFTATSIDETSGMQRVEFYAYDELQETVNGSGPTYQWIYHYPSFYALNVRGLIRNKEITDEYVKFYAMIVIISGFRKEEPPEISVYAYDNAGNKAFDEIEHPCPKVINSPGVYIFQNLTLPNSYEGFIGKYFIKAIFFI